MNRAAFGPEIAAAISETATNRAPPIIFVRHGETDWNRAARLQGQRDIPLNALGRRQAERNGRAIAGLLAAGTWSAVTSPLARATETMEILRVAAGIPELPFRTDPLLKELSYGNWEGLTLAELAIHDPDGASGREADKWGYVPPAGESYGMAARRVVNWLGTLRGPTLVVAHGGILRILLHHLAGLPAQDAPHVAAPQDRAVLFTRVAVYTI